MRKYITHEMTYSVSTMGGLEYLANVVHECSSHTPLQLINDRILLEAKRLLRYSDKKIKDIANDLGYEDPSYFVKFFKRQTGMLPTEFRG